MNTDKIRVNPINLCIIYVALLLFLLPLGARAQHYLGVRQGVSITGVNFNPAQHDTSTFHWLNAGVVYKYLDPKWFGFQTGLNYAEKGFIWNNTTRTYRMLELPLVSQFHFETWRLRWLVNVGAYAAYALSGEQIVDLGNRKEKSAYAFTDRDRRFEYGMHGGGGVAYMFDPFELQFEVGYELAFSYMMKPQVAGQPTMFNHFYKLLFSVAFLMRL